MSFITQGINTEKISIGRKRRDLYSKTSTPYDIRYNPAANEEINICAVCVNLESFLTDLLKKNPMIPPPTINAQEISGSSIMQR